MTDMDFFSEAFTIPTKLMERKGYHNVDHVAACWRHMRSRDEEGSLSLALAIYWHDVIYDEIGQNEERSKVAMLGVCTLYKPRNRSHDEWIKALQLAGRMIDATIDHDMRNHEKDTWPMIRIDLADLTMPDRTLTNYSHIMDEAVALHGCTQKEFAKKNIEFMKGLLERVGSNKTLDEENREFWSKVQDGILLTITLSEAFLK